MDIRPGYHYQYNAAQRNENGWIIVASIFGLGFIFSCLALVCALIALCR